MPHASQRRIIVTGGAGFIGSHVVLECLRQGATVRVIDDFRKEGGREVEGAEYLRIDLTDEKLAREAFDGFDRAVNMAALIGGIAYFHRYPASILAENAKICVSTLKAALAAGMERVVSISSSMVFERTSHFPSKEEDLAEIPPPDTAYGFSKLLVERLARAFYDEHGLQFVIARPFNAYGTFESPTEEPGMAHVIPDLIRKLLSQSDTLEILGDGNQSRCFTHVEDVARGIVACLFHEAAPGQDFNIADDREMTVHELVNLLMEIMGCRRPISHVRGFRHDILRRIPDVTKAKRILGFSAGETLESRLPEVIEWIRERL